MIIRNVKHRNASLSAFQEQVVLGTLLGDSSLSRPKKNGRNFHLSCYHSEKQISWLRQKHTWLAPHSRPIQECAYIDKRDGQTRRGARFHTISAPCFSEYAELFYRDGRKIISDLMLARMEHPVALACLICDDGSWDKAGIQIATKQFSENENRILAQRLKLHFGFQVDAKPGRYWNLRIPAASVPAVMEICRPYVPEFLLYKFGGGDFMPTIYCGKISQTCEHCGDVFDCYESELRRFCGRPCYLAARRVA